MAEVVKRLGEKMLDGDSVLLIILEITIITGKDRIQRTMITFFDPGSTFSLVFAKFAEKHALEGPL